MGEIIKPESTKKVEQKQKLKNVPYRADGRIREKIDKKVFYMGLAECIHQQEVTLPDRFKYRVVQNKSKCQTHLTNTVPHGPRLATYERKGKTRREKEGERIRNERNAKEKIQRKVNAKEPLLRKFLQNRVTTLVSP